MKRSEKIIVILFILVSSIMLFESCDKKTPELPITPQQVEPEDPTPDPMPDPDPVTSSTESNTIFEGILIEGSSKIEGVPPSSNGAISMNLSSASTLAISDEGFTIPIISSAEVAGVYLQIKATDGANSESYLDVDLNALSSKSNTTVLKRGKKLSKNRTAKKMTNDEINVDFTPDFSVGEFCYIICVYDNAGNISAPQEVCMNISEWGGSIELVGTWNMTSNQELYEGELDIEEVGVEYCDAVFDDCNFIEFWRVKFNEDGTFIYELKELYKESSAAAYDESEVEATGGNWTYNAATNELLFVVYNYRVYEDGVLVEEEILPTGEGELVPVQRVELVGTNLNLVWDEIDIEGDGVIDESYIEYYEKE